MTNAGGPAHHTAEQACSNCAHTPNADVGWQHGPGRARKQRSRFIETLNPGGCDSEAPTSFTYHQTRVSQPHGWRALD